MAPRKAAGQFRERQPDASQYRVTLYGSLAATGRGHRTDTALRETFHPIPVKIIWEMETRLSFHPNGMRFESLDENGAIRETWEVYSTGGGELQEENAPQSAIAVYGLMSMAEILIRCDETGQTLWEYVEQCEGAGIWDFLHDVWKTMSDAIERGIRAEGVLEGGLGLPRKAWSFHRKANTGGPHFMRTGLLSAYSLAVAEENASGGVIVTAPTCGASGVVPAVLRYVRETIDCNEQSVLRALATAGSIGNLIKHNATISGAEAGCQAEIGSACAMAAGAAAQLLGGSVRQIEYAAEMGLEHHLGLTCDPVEGLVQIPCIERNALAATRALTCADYALFSDGSHRISFDEVVEVMKETGRDLSFKYRETAFGGLAAAHRRRRH